MSYDEAFEQGYNDFRRSKGSLSDALSFYNPPDSLADAYEAGWNKASQEANQKLRRYELIVDLGVGSLLLVFSAVVLFGGIESGSPVIVVSRGTIILGLIMVGRGLQLLFTRPDTNK